MSRAKSKEERDFYVALAAKEHYSSRELERQLDSAYYERYMLSAGKQPPEFVSQSVRNSILDTYVLEFLDLPEQYSEHNFRKAIIENIKQFILEFGKDFTFIGEEYRVQVGGQDFFIDLLFYNRALSCLVPIELKIGKFKPEHIGQINFYLEALDRDVRKPNENPSVGLILCASKDDTVVEYALSRSLSPTLVSDYTLKLPDKKLLQEKLKELADIAMAEKEDEDA
jgi:predicted nuclease of restriction endonuclease-like (RecB) superfamily